VFSFSSDPPPYLQLPLSFRSIEVSPKSANPNSVVSHTAYFPTTLIVVLPIAPVGSGLGKDPKDLSYPERRTKRVQIK